MDVALTVYRVPFTLYFIHLYNKPMSWHSYAILHI